MLLEVEDDERADRHLGADVEKDAKHTESKARPAEQRPRMTERRGVIVGDLREAAAARPNHRRDHQDRGREPDVNAHDEMAFLGPEYGRGRVGQPRRINGRNRAQDEHGSHIGKDGRAEGVERLRKREPAVSGRGRPEERNERVRDHLNDRDARSKNEQGGEKCRENAGRRCGDEQQAARGHEQQADRRPAHVARASHQHRRRQGEQRNTPRRRLSARA